VRADGNQARPSPCAHASRLVSALQRPYTRALPQTSRQWASAVQRSAGRLSYKLTVFVLSRFAQLKVGIWCTPAPRRRARGRLRRAWASRGRIAPYHPRWQAAAVWGLTRSGFGAPSPYRASRGKPASARQSVLMAQAGTSASGSRRCAWGPARTARNAPSGCGHGQQQELVVGQLRCGWRCC
jgi:hypothetical protein